MRRRRLTLMLVGFCGVWGAIADGSLLLYPVPQKTVVTAADAVIPERVVVVQGQTPGAQVQYAVGQLTNDLYRYLRVASVCVANFNDAPATGATVLVIGRHGAPHVKAALDRIGELPDAQSMRPEGFHLFTRGAYGVVAGADDAGALYGSFTLAQLPRRSADVLRMPQVEIEDYPGFPVRAITSFPAKQSLWSFLDVYARLRFNRITPNSPYISFDMEQNKDGLNAQELADLKIFLTECHRRGLQVEMPFYYRGLCQAFNTGHLCASDPDNARWIQNLIEQYCRAGVDSFRVNFDDLRKEHSAAWRACERCRAAGMGLGQDNALWVKHIKEAADRHGGRAIQTAPYTYFGPPASWTNGYFAPDLIYDGRQYLEEYLGAMQDPFFKDVNVFHCTPDPAVTGVLKSMGMPNYIHWFNNASFFMGYTRYKSVFKPMGRANAFFAGFTPFAPWGIELSINSQTVEQVYSPEQMAWLQTMPQRSHGAYLCRDLLQPTLVFAQYAWSPATFSNEAWPEYDAALAARVFGPEAVPVYQEWKRKFRRICLAYNDLSAFTTDTAATMARLRQEYPAAHALLERMLAARQATVARQEFVLLDCEKDDPVESARNADKIMGELVKAEYTVRADVTPLVKRAQPHQGNRMELSRTLRLASPLLMYVMPWAVTADEHGDIYSVSLPSAGFGMTSPSKLNWFAGFFNLEVNGMSLGNAVPEMQVIELGANAQAIQCDWTLDYAGVTIVFSMLPDGGLLLDGTVKPHGRKPHTLRMSCICSPAVGASNEWRDDEMDKWVMTAGRELPHGSYMYVNLEKENWFLFYDRKNDFPREIIRAGVSTIPDGPCALVVDPENIQWMDINVGSRVSLTSLYFKKGASRFRLAFYDLNRTSNADAIAYFKARGAGIAASLHPAGREYVTGGGAP